MATFWEPSGLRILSVVVLLAFLLLTLTCLAATSGSHDNTNPPPPPSPPRIPRMVEEFYVGQHQAREGDLDGFDLFYHRLDAMERVVRSQMKKREEMRKAFHKAFQEQDKDSHEHMQIIQEMRRKLRKTQNDSEHARHDVSSRYGQEAAGQAYTTDEGAGPAYKLRFHGSLKPRIYTNKPLLKQSDEGIEIAIYRDDRIITSGDLSFVSVEIVALESNHTCKGSWTEEDFHKQIKKRRSGQGSVLEGDLSVKLVNGKASLGKIWFIEGSSGTRTREFVLAARIVRSENIEGLRVEEAFMQPAITVLVERSEGNAKSVIPMLNDKVHCLKDIAKGGRYSDRLEQHGISTVQDFLKALNKDADNLREILKMKSDKSWKALVEHARECDLRDEHELKVKSYMVERENGMVENVALFFNCIHDNVGAEFDGRYVAKDKFDTSQKVSVASLKKLAYECNELEDIPFQYVMKDNSPEKISANVIAAGNSSIPMSGAPPWNTSDHHAHVVSQGANCNAAGPSASEPSPPGQHYTPQNQGVAENSIPEGGTVRPDAATTDVGSEPDWAALGPLPCASRDLFMSGDPFQIPSHDKFSANVNAAGSSSIPMSGASPQNTSDHHAHAASQVEKLGPSGIGPEPEPDLRRGGANCNAAGPSASEPSPHHHYTHQSQGVAESSVPEEDAIRPDTATTDVDSDTSSETFLASDQLDQPIYTPYGPDLDPLMPREEQSLNFWTNHRSFGEFPTFPPPEDQSQNFPTAPSGGGGN